MSNPAPRGADEGVCKGCGKRIWWIQILDGPRVPIDPVPPTYEFFGMLEPVGWRRSAAYVSHFATCPHANRFSSRTKKAQEPPS